ncbi:MAG: hypothetical protein AB1832_10630 [Pseudomonadota bacterium]
MSDRDQHCHHWPAARGPVPVHGVRGEGDRDAAASGEHARPGSLTVGTDGRVVGHTLDDAAQLPAPVVDVIDRNIARWRFQPVLRDSHAVSARSRMSLRVVAQPGGRNDHVLSIHDVHFGAADDGGGSRIRSIAPKYPPEAMAARVAGTV